MSQEGKYTSVEMDEKKSNKGNNDLEQPFDEDFWLKVSVCIDSYTQSKIFKVTVIIGVFCLDLVSCKFHLCNFFHPILYPLSHCLLRLL